LLTSHSVPYFPPFEAISQGTWEKLVFTWENWRKLVNIGKYWEIGFTLWFGVPEKCSYIYICGNKKY